MLQKWLGHARLKTTTFYADAAGKKEQDIASGMWGVGRMHLTRTEPEANVSDFSRMEIVRGLFGDQGLVREWRDGRSGQMRTNGFKDKDKDKTEAEEA